MLIIGCDYHPSVQRITFVDLETGECGERRLMHKDGEAERLYRDLKLRGVSVRVGIEATGHARWFERLLAELGFELWIGDPARIKAARVRKQKTDRQDAQLLLKLLVEEIVGGECGGKAADQGEHSPIWHALDIARGMRVPRVGGCAERSKGK
jgi:transposase